MFTAIKKDSGYLPAMEYHPSTANETYKIGEVLVLSAGSLTKCSASTKPYYVCQEEYSAPATGNKRILVMPISPFITYKTVSSAAMANTGSGAVNAGDVVTISADGLKATATPTNGVATIVYKSGTSSGSEVHVKFL